MMRYCEINEGITTIWWHGSPSGDLRGGTHGLHVGTKQAATEALESRIGIPADGKGWTGDREYGKTLLAGKATLKKMNHSPTGYNCGAPEEDFYPADNSYKAKHSDGSIIPMTDKPSVKPYYIIGPMTNSIYTPYEDGKANALMKAQKTRYGQGKRGYYYTNIGEDSGSISAVVPSGAHLQPL